MEKKLVLLSIGSNLGDRIENVERAINLLKEYKVVENIKVSSFYETEPVGYKNQPYFINVAIVGETKLSPEELLIQCKLIEKRLGRIERPRWREREVDLDIILYDNELVDTKELKIPHPQMHARRFVLVPANEIAGSWFVPNFKMTISELLARCKDDSKVVQINDN